MLHHCLPLTDLCIIAGFPKESTAEEYVMACTSSSSSHTVTITTKEGRGEDMHGATHSMHAVLMTEEFSKDTPMHSQTAKG